MISRRGLFKAVAGAYAAAFIAKDYVRGILRRGSVTYTINYPDGAKFSFPGYVTNYKPLPQVYCEREAIETTTHLDEYQQFTLGRMRYYVDGNEASVADYINALEYRMKHGNHEQQLEAVKVVLQLRGSHYASPATTLTL